MFTMHASKVEGKLIRFGSAPEIDSLQGFVPRQSAAKCIITLIDGRQALL